MEESTNHDLGISYLYIDKEAFKEYQKEIEKLHNNPTLYKEYANYLIKELDTDREKALLDTTFIKYTHNCDTKNEYVDQVNFMYELQLNTLKKYPDSSTLDMKYYYINIEEMLFFKKCMFYDNSVWFFYSYSTLSFEMPELYLPRFKNDIYNYIYVDEHPEYFQLSNIPGKSDEFPIYKIEQSYLKIMEDELETNYNLHINYKKEAQNFKRIIQNARNNKLDIYFWY